MSERNSAAQQAMQLAFDRAGRGRRRGRPAPAGLRVAGQEQAPPAEIDPRHQAVFVEARLPAAVGMEEGHPGVGAERDRGALGDRASPRNADRRRRQPPAVARLRREDRIVRARAQRVVIGGSAFHDDRLEQGAIAADAVERAKIPDVANLEGGEHVRHQLAMILVRVAEDQMVDRGQQRPDRSYIGDDPVAVATRRVVIAAGVVEQGEITALDEDREAGADVDRVDDEIARQWRAASGGGRRLGGGPRPARQAGPRRTRRTISSFSWRVSPAGRLRPAPARVARS